LRAAHANCIPFASASLCLLTRQCPLSPQLSELIHKSAEYPELKYARVSVYFQDIVDDTATEDGYTVVPGSQLVVTRTAHKDNTSSYYVDGKKMSADEVTTLLRKRGIDLDNNRFLILQGEVEQIAMMKPKAQVRAGCG
jgi:structural maintenance of chromosome 4